jgi:hypothetical protein
MPPSVQHRYSPAVNRPQAIRLLLPAAPLWPGGFARFGWKAFVTILRGIR